MTTDIADAIERAARTATPDTRRRRVWRAIERVHPFLGLYETVADADRLRPNIHCVVTERCNYRCPFCQAFLDHESKDPALDEVRRAVDRAARLVPGARWTISGGEPTLRADLPAIVAHILEQDPDALVVVQTNGALVGRHPERYAVAPSPRLRFLVALHAAADDVYDAVTGTRGQLRHAAAGMRALVDAGHTVELNCVISSLNADHIAAYVERLPALCEGRPAPTVHLSVLGFTDSRDVSPFVVPYDRVVAIGQAALAAGRRAGVEVNVSLTARHSSVPVCLLDASSLDTSEYPHMYRHDAEHVEDDGWWTKPAVCDECRLAPHCRGLPKPYVAAVGEGAIRPIPRLPSPPDGNGGSAP